jgi:hypothetical protein
MVTIGVVAGVEMIPLAWWFGQAAYEGVGGVRSAHD